MERRERKNEGKKFRIGSTRTSYILNPFFTLAEICYRQSFPKYLKFYDQNVLSILPNSCLLLLLFLNLCPTVTLSVLNWNLVPFFISLSSIKTFGLMDKSFTEKWREKREGKRTREREREEEEGGRREGRTNLRWNGRNVEGTDGSRSIRICWLMDSEPMWIRCGWNVTSVNFPFDGRQRGSNSYTFQWQVRGRNFYLFRKYRHQDWTFFSVVAVKSCSIKFFNWKCRQDEKEMEKVRGGFRERERERGIKFSQRNRDKTMWGNQNTNDFQLLLHSLAYACGVH